MPLGSISAVKARVPKKAKEEADAMRRGGKKKKAKRGKKAKAGDMVMLQSGKVPITPAGGVMGAGRLQSPGLLFGGAMPGPLQSTTYATAPQVAKPFSRIEFIGSSDEFYNRGRNKSDDVVVPVNPSGIAPDNTPSRRLIPSNNPNAPVLITYNYNASLPFEGEVPRLNNSFRESVRAMPSQPTTGNLNSRYPVLMDSEGNAHLANQGVHYAVPSGVEIEEASGRKTVKEVAENMRKALEKEPVKASQPAPKAFQWRKHLDDARSMYPTVADLKKDGFTNYKDVIDNWHDLGLLEEPAMKRGGRVRSGIF